MTASEEIVLEGEDMIYCTQCGAGVHDGNQFCGKCGTKAEITAVVRREPRFWRVSGKDQATVPSRRFSQVFGLDPRIAFLTLIIDMMLNAGDLLSMGLLVPLSMLAGVVLGYVVYRAQINWYGDDPEDAKIKAIVIGLLTAIPTPIPELLYLPAGLLGVFNRFWKKESHSQ
jgi:hypothetical protein